MNNSAQYSLGDSDNRPWGRWEVIAIGEGFVLKLIQVKPGGILSLQSHEHRCEHWTILEGEGVVSLDGSECSLGPNYSIFIPAKSKHRIRNESDEVVKFIELQTGDNLDENDIIRYQDEYGRA